MLRIPEDERLREEREMELLLQSDIDSDQPEQPEIDRDLAIYDIYSHR